MAYPTRPVIERKAERNRVIHGTHQMSIRDGDGKPVAICTSCGFCPCHYKDILERPCIPNKLKESEKDG